MDRAAKQGRGLWAGASLIAVAAILSGCAEIRSSAHDFIDATNIAPLPVDPSSPVAADVARAEQINGPIPSFASVPPKPTDIRPAAAYKSQVVGVVGDRRALSQWEAAHPPVNSDTDAFASAQQAKLAGEKQVSSEKEAESAAFSKRLHEAADIPTKAKSKPSPKPNS